MKLPKYFIRLIMSIGCAVGTGAIAAITVAIVDLYLAGHGYGSILKEIITWEPGGVHLSYGDLVMLIASVLSGYVTWHQLSRDT